jgi:hypothetical protein
MRQELYDLLPFILPTENAPTADQNNTLAHKYFLGRYGHEIMKILHMTNIVAPEKAYLPSADISKTIDTIKAYMDLVDQASGIFYLNNKIQVCSGTKTKPGFIENLRKQQQQGKIIPAELWHTKKQRPGFDNDCIVGLIFWQFLIVFRRISIIAHMSPDDKNLEYNIANASQLTQETNELSNFLNAFYARQSRVEGAKKSADKRGIPRERYTKLIYDMGLQSKDMSQQQIPETRKKIRQEYCKRYKCKKSPLVDKILDDVLLSAPKRDILAS